MKILSKEDKKAFKITAIIVLAIVSILFFIIVFSKSDNSTPPPTTVNKEYFKNLTFNGKMWQWIQGNGNKLTWTRKEQDTLMNCVILGAIGIVILLIVGVILLDRKVIDLFPWTSIPLLPEIDTNGVINELMICPHCQQKGYVRTKPIIQKKGISGGKATAAVLTGGASVLLTGLSRKEANTQAHCDYCGQTWIF